MIKVVTYVTVEEQKVLRYNKLTWIAEAIALTTYGTYVLISAMLFCSKKR